MQQSDDLGIVIAVGASQIARAYELRREVFIEEQGVPEAIERDSDDCRALHVIAIDDAKTVGCGRMIEEPDCVKIGRMAVARSRRSMGIGSRILKCLIETARTRGRRRIVLHAQLTAEGFYLKHGFKPVGDIFDEAGIPHRRMELDL